MVTSKMQIGESFWREALRTSFRKDVPILLYLVYMWFGVIENGIPKIYQLTTSNFVMVTLILCLIIIPFIPVAMRVWRTS